MREALRYLDQIIAQTKLLCAHKIVNKEQLISIRLDWNPRYPLRRMPGDLRIATFAVDPT